MAMKTILPRIPEGGAIEDSQEMNMERYSEIMKKALGHGYRRFVTHIVQQVQPGQGATVLEIGPGPGWVGIWLAKERPDIRLDGMEVSPDMRRVATANAQAEGVAERVRYCQGVVENMQQLADHAYDLVISRDSLHHWDDPRKGFQEIARVVKSDGQVYIQDSRRDLLSSQRQLSRSRHHINRKVTQLPSGKKDAVKNYRACIELYCGKAAQSVPAQKNCSPN